VALPDRANSRVVLIGFSAFADFAKIPAVPNNLRRLKDVFADEKVGGIDRRHITVVTGLRGLSRNTLLSRLQRVAKEATDTLVVYYVGHGFLDEDDNDSLLLALPGTRRRQHFSALPYEEIRRAVRNAGARRKVVILDCCYSGRAHSDGFLDSAGDAQQLAHQAPIEGACVLTATSDYARARATPGGHYTDFSGALISALENGLPGNGPYLDVQSVFAFLRQEMRSRSLPLPHLSTRDDGSALVLGRNVAHTGTVPAEPVVSPPVGEEPPRRRLPSRRRLALLAAAAIVVAAVPVTVFVTGTDRSSAAGACPAGPARAVEPSHGDRPGPKTRFPGTRFKLLRALTGPATLVAFEPPMPKGAAHPVTYLWQPDRRCFAPPAGFGSTYLDVAVSSDGKWIAGVDRRRLDGAGVVVMDRAGGHRQVIDVPPGAFATGLMWNRASDTLLFTEAPIDSTSPYDYPRGADVVIASVPDVRPKVLRLGATAPYQWGTDNTIAGNYGDLDPLDVRFFDVKGRKLWSIGRAGLLGDYGLGAFSPSGEQIVTHCPQGQADRACVRDARTGDLLVVVPSYRLFTDRPYENLGWYDEKHLLMSVWDAKTNWWADAAVDVEIRKGATLANSTTILGRMPDRGGHLIFEGAPS
jgi:hypothetical protein